MAAMEKFRRLMAEKGQDPLRVIGIIATLFWLALVMLAAWLTPDSLDNGGLLAWVVWILGAGLPLALIWIAVHCAQTLEVLRGEAFGLRQALQQMRGAEPAPPEQGIRETAPPARRLPAAPVPRPTPMPTPPRAAEQPAEPQAPEPQADPRADGATANPRLSPAELYFALNFPEGPDDHEAIRCLQLALDDRELARLIRAAQDVITLLAARGVYMDDLQVPETDAASWQLFAQGARGAQVADLAVIDNEAALQVTGGMLDQDEVFRDVAHHFLRRFDRLLAHRAQTDDPAVLAVLSETRSGRAFILLAQVSGMMGPDPLSDLQPDAETNDS